MWTMQVYSYLAELKVDEEWERNVMRMSISAYAQLDAIGELTASKKLFLCLPIIRLLYEQIQVLYLLVCNSSSSLLNSVQK